MPRANGDGHGHSPTFHWLRLANSVDINRSPGGSVARRKAKLNAGFISATEPLPRPGLAFAGIDQFTVGVDRPFTSIPAAAAASQRSQPANRLRVPGGNRLGREL